MNNELPSPGDGTGPASLGTPEPGTTEAVPDYVTAWWRLHEHEQHTHAPDSDHAAPWPLWRDRFIWTCDPAVQDQPGSGRQLWRSETTLQPGIGAGHLHAPAGFYLIDAWSLPPYRLVWFCAAQRIILTYAEGDLTYIACDDQQALRAVITEHGAFYRHQ